MSKIDLGDKDKLDFLKKIEDAGYKVVHNIPKEKIPQRFNGIDVKFCPECGNQDLNLVKYMEQGLLEMYYVCPECRAIFYVNDMAWKYGKREYYYENSKLSKMQK